MQVSSWGSLLPLRQTFTALDHMLPRAMGFAGKQLARVWSGLQHGAEGRDHWSLQTAWERRAAVFSSSQVKGEEGRGAGTELANAALSPPVTG